MLHKHLWRTLGRMGVSLLCAGASYIIWMAAFLLAVKPHNPLVEGVLWVLAPVVTAAGFATGVMVFDHLIKATRPPFSRVLIWPLAGCAVGAGAVYWFGPMLIVFGMFVAGTLSIALREVVGLTCDGYAE